VYFKTEANESDVIVLQNRIKTLPEVANVDYTSREKAYEQFQTRHQDDTATLQALKEVGGNPFGASFNIKAKDPTQYEKIVKFIEDQQGISRGEESSNGNSIISRINYTDNKQAIDALSRIMNASNALGYGFVIFFAFVAILITFNTVRLTIYVFREEIAVMRLVGASEMYIRGPFVIVGLLYGIVSGVLTLLILIPATSYVGPVIYKMGTGLNLSTYYVDNIWFIALVIIGSGLVLGAVSSFLAVRKYLKV
jgi:cell division transport system permease protein